MSQYAIAMDLDRCVGCLACSTACKQANQLGPGKFFNKIKRVGPNPKYDGAQYPDIEMYFMVQQCQHCANPECVDVCPTGASAKRDDGIVTIDAEQCIGCQACVPVCPYNARFLDGDTGVVEKCSMCASLVDEGDIPMCVSQCTGMARFFGDADGDIREFKGINGLTLGEVCKDFTDDQVYRYDDSGNGPSFVYILRHKVWHGIE